MPDAADGQHGPLEAVEHHALLARELVGQVGRPGEARRPARRSPALTRDDAERRLLERRMEELAG